MSKFRVNREILNFKPQAKEVRYIDENEEQRGVLPTEKAILLAQSVGLSLVEVDPNARPPVCKALDYNRFQYEKKKRMKSGGSQVAKKDKEVKITTVTGDNDYQVKLRKVISLLEAGHRVKVTIRYRFRRDSSNADISNDIIDRVKNDLAEHAKIESEPKMEGRQASIYFIKKK